MATPDTRELTGSPRVQGVDEEIVHEVVTPTGTAPTTVSVVVKDTTDSSADVTATVMPSGSASVSTDTITLPVLKLLEAGHWYRVEVKFTSGANVFERFFRVQAEE